MDNTELMVRALSNSQAAGGMPQPMPVPTVPSFQAASNDNGMLMNILSNVSSVLNRPSSPTLLQTQPVISGIRG